MGEFNGPGGGGLVVQRYDTSGLVCTPDVSGGAELECEAPDAGPGLSDVATWDYDGDGAADDCDPRDPTIPGVEVCNGLDDDCNGLADDGIVCNGCTAHHVGGITYQHCDAAPVNQAASFGVCAALDADRYEVLTLSDATEWEGVKGFTQRTWTGLEEVGTHQYRWASGEDSWFHPWVQASCGAGSQPDNTDACVAMIDTLGTGCEGSLDDRTCTDLLPVVCEACDWRTFYVDLDGDGAGDVSQPIEACRAEGLGSVAEVAGDCDDADPAVHPGAAETCDGIDNDCDGHVDPMGLLFEDVDADAAGDPAAPLIAESCAELPAVSASPDATDCDDASLPQRPTAAETCNGIDDDCDGHVDEDDVCPTCTHVALRDTDYQVCSALVAFSVAEGICDTRGGTLASLATVEENQRLSAVVAAGVQRRFWMGLLFDGYEWGWLDGTPYELELWDDDEPSGDGPLGELWDAPPGDRFGTWNDSAGSNTNGFLCEIGCQVEPLYADTDGDGFGAGPKAYACPGDGWSANDADCDDTDPSLRPGAWDVPGDDIDQDCTGTLRCYIDEDGDGFGIDAFDLSIDCTGPGVADVAGDCDDADDTIFPGAFDVPGDDIDQDCDQRDTCFVDEDGDGYGAGAPVPGSDDRCVAPGEARVAGDCDDTDDAVFPTATEVAVDGIDNDCDGFDQCYEDLDLDGYGSSVLVDATAVRLDPCPDPGVSTVDGDCAPSDPAIHPGAEEIVGTGADENCDFRETCYIDGDLDTFGGGTESTADIACDDPGHTLVGGDCADDDALRFPGATELPADGVDQDCDDQELCFRDGDGDGVVAPAQYTVQSATLSCLAAELSPVPGDDCDDRDASIYPGAPEVVNDAIDQDCDSFDACWPDGDLDGYGADDQGPVPAPACTDLGFSGTADDCDDADPNSYPGATELPDGGVDQDCNGFELCAFDDDFDGFEGLREDSLGGCAVPSTELDCDDGDDQIYPGAPEVPVDGIDQDCDGFEACWVDDDDDGYGDDSVPAEPGPLVDPKDFCDAPGLVPLGGDCDDAAEFVNPAVPEFACDGVDNDCDPNTLDCPYGTVETGPTGLPTVVATADTGTQVETGPDTGTPGTTQPTPTTDDPLPSTTPGDDELPKAPAAGGCACQQGMGGATWWLLAVAGGLLPLRRRQRIAHR